MKETKNLIYTLRPFYTIKGFFRDMKEFNIIIEKGEDGYFLSEVIELPGCRTQAKTLDDLMKRTKKAILLYLKCEKPKFNDKFVGLQKITV